MIEPKVTRQRSHSANPPVESRSSTRTLSASASPSSVEHDRFSTPQNSSEFHSSSHFVLPSIEGDTGSNSASEIGTDSTLALRNGNNSHSKDRTISTPQTPSLSITRTDSSSSQLFTPISGNESSPSRREASTGGLDAQLEGLRFPTASPGIDLSSVANAIQDVATGIESIVPFLHARSPALASPSPSPRGSHSRRSSSRAAQEIHKVEDEVPPQDRFNDPSFQHALGDARRSVVDLVSVLKSSHVHNEPDSQMKRLCGEALRLSQFQCPPTRTVGLIGESGVGKSSLLNSILDRNGLARTSNSGAACTCVVTEYHYHSDSSFALEVDRFSLEENRDQLHSLLQSYRHFHNNQESLEPEDYKYFEERAGLARDTFRTMFRGLLEDEDILTLGTESHILQMFTSWMINASPNIDQGKQSMPNANECSDLLMRLTSEDASADSGAVWPWIKKIKVYLNAHILRRGLILVDLPGLRDLNSARRHITERYLLDCDEIFVICNEGRATTDAGVQDVVDLANKAKLSNVGIICTKSDDIKADEAIRDWKGAKAKEIQRKTEILANDVREIKSISQEIKEFDEFEDEMNDEERVELLSLHERLRKAKQRRNEHRFDLDRYLIKQRNESVESKLLSLYKSQVSGDLLKVFCVSNSMYWNYRMDPKDKAIKHLDLSGIIAIREHCMAMVSESQYSAAKKYMEDDIDVLIGELSLWVESGKGSMSAERKETIRNTLETIEEKLYDGLHSDESSIGNLSDIYREQFDTIVYQPSSNRLGNWSSAAQRASSQWSSWHHSSYAAFVRNFGCYTTPIAGYRNWNEEIMASMATDLTPVWQDICSVLDQRNGQALGVVDDLFRSAIVLLDTNVPNSRELQTTLISHKRVLKTSIETILEKLDKDLRTLSTDVLSSHRSSFIGESMNNAYESAQRESGKGSDARRKAHIDRSVGRNDLFFNLMRSFRTDFNNHADEAQERIEDTIDQQLDDIGEMFDIVRNENVALESERDPDFRARVEHAVRATRTNMDLVRRILEA